MNHLQEAILNVLQESAAIASQSPGEPLAEAAVFTFNAMCTDGMTGLRHSWVYQSIIHGVFESGAIRLDGQDIVAPREPF
jgi:hypothetical protein